MIKKYWDKFLLILSAIGAVAFLISRLFKAAPRSSDKLAETLIDDQKKQLNEEKSQVVKEMKEIEKKEYTAEEIEKMFNEN